MDEKKETKLDVDFAAFNNEGVIRTLAEITKDVMQTGNIPKETFGFDQAKMDLLYGQAYRLYQNGRYQEAIQMFRLLAVLGAKEPKYSLGLAACFHMLKEYDNANQFYTFAAVLDPNDPIPYFHSSDCYIQMNNTAGAIFCLEMAIKRAGNRPEYQILKDRATLTVNGLKKDLLKKGNQK